MGFLMKELLDKLSSYNIFNYLLPGVVFAALASTLTSYKFIQGDIVIGAFVYYFIGLVVSRVGSLILEPLLKRFVHLPFAPYESFVAASKLDPTLPILSEANNTYRTLSALSVVLALLKAYELLTDHFPMVKPSSPYILLGALFILFVLSYKK